MKREQHAKRKSVKAPAPKPARKELSTAVERHRDHYLERREKFAQCLKTTAVGLNGQLFAIEQIADLAIHGRVVDFPNGEDTLTKEQSDALDTHLFDLHSALYMIAALARAWQEYTLEL